MFVYIGYRNKRSVENKKRIEKRKEITVNANKINLKSLYCFVLFLSWKKKKIKPTKKEIQGHYIVELCSILYLIAHVSRLTLYLFCYAASILMILSRNGCNNILVFRNCFAKMGNQLNIWNVQFTTLLLRWGDSFLTIQLITKVFRGGLFFCQFYN